MRLKQLKLQGYKTFASKTEFQFDDGITAIVGPNGSGKSNIADALRWVLGEQSYGTLRGKRTADMIFAGSQTRPRAGMAQAILTLDNSDGWLPIDYSEVEIGRRAYRSGENEYILNGQKVRLKDITELLATSGLAERTYTIIGQGLIDQALSLKADERRALFEEAAGVNHYKTRRAETLRRLQETQHNLERIHDILAEIRPRLSSLRRQATRAQNHAQIAADLRGLLLIWYGYKWEQAKADLRVARESATTAETGWEASRRQLLVYQQDIDERQRQSNRLQQRLMETQEQRDRVRDELERARRETAILQERKEAIRRQLAEVELELPQLEAQRERAHNELNTAVNDLSSAQTELRDSQQSLQQFNTTFQTQQATITRWQNTLREAEQSRGVQQTRIAQAEGQLSQLQERLRERQLRQEASPDEELAGITADLAKQTAVLETAQARAAELATQRSILYDERRTLIATLKQLRADLREQERLINKQRSQVARLEARAEMLDQLRQKTVPATGHGRVLGQLAAFLTIPDAHRRAVEAALADRLATLVVADRHQLQQLLTANPEQALSAIALNDARPFDRPDLSGEHGILGWADAFVSAEAAAAPAVRALLGPVLLVADGAAALRSAAILPAGTLAVAPDGLIAHAAGLVETHPGAAQDSPLAREAAWRAAQEELAATRQEAAALETAVTGLQAAIQEKQDRVDALQNDERRLGGFENETAQRAAQAQRQIDRLHQQRDFIERQQKARQQELERLHSRIAEVEQALVGQRDELVRLDTAVTSARAELEQLPVAEAHQQREGLQQSISTAQTIVAGRQAVVDSRRATLNQVEQQLARVKDRAERLKLEQQEIETSDQDTQRRRLQEELDRLQREIDPLQERLAETRRELMSLQEKVASVQRHTHDLETQYTQTRVKLTQRENQIEGLQERIKADIGLVALAFDEEQTGATPLPIGDMVEHLPLVQHLPSDIEETILQYRGQLQRMGAINPDAPDEYRETQERHDFLTQQVEDLNDAERQLRTVIAELDELTSKAFARTVDEVNTVFGETFTQLFGGGSARLVLTDPDDLTVSGVDIIARLPSRREQGLGLLSGGERSLTASALIFSLLKVSPTPFCVMDEVDAALDEANINRFRDLLHELSLKTQFVVITHNRGTVQVAQTIYGVSMQPDSSSQVISIKPEEYLSRSKML